MGEAAGEPPHHQRVHRRAGLAGPQARPQEREETIHSQDTRSAEGPQVAVSRVHRQADLLQCLQRAVCVWELLRVVWTLHLYAITVPEDGLHGPDLQAALDRRRQRDVAFLGQGESSHLQPLLQVCIRMYQELSGLFAAILCLPTRHPLPSHPIPLCL